MLHVFSRGVFHAALLCLLAGLSHAASAGIEVYSKPAQVQPYSLKLSPTGQYYAVIASRIDRSILLIFDRATNKVTANVTPSEGQFIESFWWVNDKRVVLTFSEKEGYYSQPFWTGELLGIDADGKNLQYIFGYRAAGGEGSLGSRVKRDVAIRGFAYVLESRTDENNNILIGIDKWDGSSESSYLQIARLNVNSGVLKPTGGRLPLRETDNTLVDRERKIRVVSGTDRENYSKLLYLDPVSGEWQVLNEEAVSKTVIDPLGFTSNGTDFYISVYKSGQPAYLGVMNPRDRSIRKVFEPKTADIGGLMMKADESDAYAVRIFEGDGRGGFALLDKASPEAQLARKMITKFPGEFPYITSFSRDGRYASVFVTSDVNPGQYHIHDRDTDTLSPSLQVRPDINIDAAAVMRPVEFKARDGLTIRGWLTVPNAPAGKLPMVVMPHGGPYGVVDRWEFNADAQMLASRGYAVLQINFRGSAGYGKDFADAGLREWGGKMQTDLSDGTRAVLEKFPVDSNRICLYGISYGAYASLLGVATEPALYKCAIGYSGAYDLQIVRNQGDITQRASGRTYLNDVLDKDPAWLKARSPTNLAGNIKAPVLLIHGGKDARTPPIHAETMRRALIGAGNPPAWLFKETEGHGFFEPANVLLANQQIIDFLDKHIGPQAK